VGEETKVRYIRGEAEGKRQRGTDIGKETEGNMQEKRETRRRGGWHEVGEREGERETKGKRE
jgi:hypothetical protein